MNIRPVTRWLVWAWGVPFLAVGGALAGGSLAAAEARSDRGMVATVHPLATDAATQVLRDGGNAVDAAIAAALMLGVVDGHNSGIGGGCLILIREPNGRFRAIDGRETAPARATPDMFLRDGRPLPEASQTGPLAVATPGALAAYDLALRRAGRKNIGDLLRPAALVAEQGFAIDRVFARNLKSAQPNLARFPGAKQMLLQADGSAPEEGYRLRLPELAATYRAVAEEGIDWFYRGPFAATVGKWMADNGGLLSQVDFAEYRAIEREPIISTYRGLTIVGFPPPSSGGIHVAQILNMLEHFDLRESHRRDPAECVHRVGEAMKAAFADRAHWLGDADFAPVPRGLIDKEYARQLAARIVPDRVTKIVSFGEPANWQSDTFSKHTTHIAAADADGYWVGITATVNTSFGSKVVVPGTGVILNNEMDDFSIHPGVANAFGLVGSEANAIAPRKRPLSSMSPTIVLDQPVHEGGRPVLTVGAAGGPTIINQVVLAIVRRVDLEMPLDAALATPRFHHQWVPDELSLEPAADESLVAGLTRRGHALKRRQLGVTQAIAWSQDDGQFIGVHDPRVPGKASGP